MLELKIIEDHLPIRRKSRPGIKRPETRALVVHYTGGPGHTAKIVRNWFRIIGDSEDKYPAASSNYIIDLNGDIYEIIPKEEVSWHGGGRSYTDLAKKLFTTPKGYIDPNLYSIGIEVCHPDVTGKFTNESLEGLRRLLLYLRFIYGNIPIIRHHDITGKLCPLWFVQYPEEWNKFLKSLEA